jgi:hypothetical protein
MAQQTAVEKAKELVNKYLKASFGAIEEYIPVPLSFAKQCALIAVDEILKLVSNDLDLYYKDCIYWEEVKTEIEKL